MMETACAGRCVCSMWVQDGIQYRSNILTEPGQKVQLHAHHYDHTARIKGRMLMQITAPEVSEREVENEDVVIPAWHIHGFTLIEGVDGVGEVLCFWRAA